MANPKKAFKDSFRIPNSVIQGMTTTVATSIDSATALNRLTAFQMVAFLGLLTKVRSKHAHEEVRATVSEILKVIEVSRSVAHAVDRTWETNDGQVKQRRYTAHRHSPMHLSIIHEVLLALHNKTVVIRGPDARNKKQVAVRAVHLLDSFGYTYEREGKELDLHDLPPGCGKVNVSTEDRPVWRLIQKTENGNHFDRPTGILYRLNTELASELINERGTIGFTLMAKKVFGLFKGYMRNPAAIRLILLILRQTGAEFSRRLMNLIADLGFDPSHPNRAIERLDTVLVELRAAQLVNTYEFDHDADVVRVQVNRSWYQEEV